MHAAQSLALYQQIRKDQAKALAQGAEKSVSMYTTG